MKISLKATRLKVGDVVYFDLDDSDSYKVEFVSNDFSEYAEFDYTGFCEEYVNSESYDSKRDYFVVVDKQVYAINPENPIIISKSDFDRLKSLRDILTCE